MHSMNEYSFNTLPPSVRSETSTALSALSPDIRPV